MRKRLLARELHFAGFELLDGHYPNIRKEFISIAERDDVIKYRMEFLEKMKEYEKRMIRRKELDPNILETSTDSKEYLLIPTGLPEGQRPLLFYTHDESTFYANDGQRMIWHPKGEMPLRKKGRGRSIMVSNF